MSIYLWHHHTWKKYDLEILRNFCLLGKIVEDISGRLPSIFLRAHKEYKPPPPPQVMQRLTCMFPWLKVSEKYKALFMPFFQVCVYVAKRFVFYKDCHRKKQNIHFYFILGKY